ncbi:MAG: hypothetical protein H7Y08_00870 [Rhizobiaceae bacterium]|nr:hypothetical protein [Rhizobiaceae bacterium]
MAGFNDWLDVTDPKLMAESLADQFRLSQNEFLKAQQALAPAFALGFQRAMTDPKAWSNLQGAGASMLPGAGGGQAPQILDLFFGSDALTNAVARQASLFAGIAPDTIQKLMPSLAMLSMDAMMRATMANLARQHPQGLATGDFGGATAEMMRRGANAVEALTRPSDEAARRRDERSGLAPAFFGDVFQEAMKGGLAWMGRGYEPQNPPGRPVQSPVASGPSSEVFNPMMPFAALFDAFARGMQGAGEDVPSAGEPVPREGQDAPRRPDAEAAHGAPGQAETSSSGPVDASDDGIVGEMMRSGHKMQEEYAREMASLFDRYQRIAPAS